MLHPGNTLVDIGGQIIGIVRLTASQGECHMRQQRIAVLAMIDFRMEHDGELDWAHLQNSVELLPTTRELVQGEQDLYRDPQMSFGAQLALEWQAYTMLRKLYDGARNYLSLWSNPDEFHEACEYFYAHIGATEKEHKEESLKAVKRYATSEENLAKILEGYRLHLDLIFNFWRGLQQAIITVPERSTAVA